MIRQLLPRSEKVNRGCCEGCQVSGAKVQKLPYSLNDPSLSKVDNAKTEAVANDMAKIPYRAIVGMLSYIMGHTNDTVTTQDDGMSSSFCVWLSIVSRARITD